MRAREFFTGGVKEAKRPLPQASELKQKSFADISAELGKGKTTALVKHKWFMDYSSYDKAYKHGVDRGQFHEVEVYPYMASVHKNEEGKVRPTTMLRFHFADAGKVSQVHKFIRDKEPGEEERRNPGTGWRYVKSWKSDLDEGTTSLNKLYAGNFPDRDESFWDEVRSDEFDEPLEVKTMPKYKLAIMLQGQYRVEHLDELVDMMDEEQQEVLQRYMTDPNLSSKIILISGHRIIDGNHRALAAAMKGVPINYVDLADLDEQGVTESIQHNSQDLKDVAEWMRTTPDKLNIVVKQEPIEKFIKQIREMYGTYDEFPEDEERTNRILKLLKRGANPLPMYVEANDPDLFVMEGRHRMVAFWLAGMKNIPIAYVSVKDQQGVAENNENTGGDYAIHLGNLKRFFKAEDPLEELVPERRTHYYALHSDMFKDDGSALPWRKTFASLTGKDFKEVLHNPRILSGYRPKKYPIPPGTLVGDMHLANLYYSKVFAKTPEEKQEIARQYKESLVPLEVADLSKYKKPELLIPKGQGVAEDTVDEAKRRTRKKYHTPRSITTGWWSGYYGDDSSGGEGGGGE